MVDFIHNNKELYGVEAICRILPIAPSTYYRMMCAELAGDFHLGDSRQLTDKSLLPFDLVS